MVADIFPTGWHATEMAGLQPGETIVIYGGGPVGLMAAYSAVIRGACKVMVVDRALEGTNGLGAHRGCECVGYQAHDPQGYEHPNDMLNKLVQSVRFTGGIGVVGVDVPEDPGSRLDAKTGREQEVERFLHAALDLVDVEDGTPLWFALRLGR